MNGVGKVIYNSLQSMLDDEKMKFKSTDLFPIANTDKCQFFTIELCMPYENQQFAKMLNENRKFFRSGWCYTTAENVVAMGKELGLDIEFYSGWVRHGTWLHHAWAVVDKIHLIDLTISKRETILLKTVNTEEPQWRERVAPILIEYGENPLPVEMDCVFGQPLDSMFYFGSPDTPINARRIFNRLMKKIPRHPSYARKGKGNEVGASELQKLLWKGK